MHIDMKYWKNLLTEFRALKISLSFKFVVGTALALLLVMSISIYFITEKDEMLILEQLDIQAKTLFSQIVLTRRWIADHGGIFVEKLPWKTASPYLEEPEIADFRGKQYIKESPAMVTKELSKYARDEGAFWFNITSLKLLNPENAPDTFEREALIAFDSGDADELSSVEVIEGSPFYRYIAPLYMEEPCLKCHEQQGYQLGDMRGAISVSIPMGHALSMLNSEKRSLYLASFVTIVIVMVVLFIMMKELVLRPVHTLKTSMERFSKGDNSGISIIRTGDELEDLSNSFVAMSQSLRDYHSDLEQRIEIATKSLEEANTRLLELNEKKSDFIAKISHELRTPMTSIKGAMEYVKTKLSMVSGNNTDTLHLVEFLDVIKNNADRLIRMVNDTLDLERIESGMFDLHREHMDLVALIKDVIISFQSISGERNIRFKIIADQEVSIHADEDRIRQVLINLISNAMNFTPDNSEIQITVSDSDETVTVSLKDEGPGIPHEVQEKIFDKFYTVGKRHGTGLGLSICKGIIEAHGGEINVSRDTGLKGGTIFFKLPKMRERIVR